MIEFVPLERLECLVVAIGAFQELPQQLLPARGLEMIGHVASASSPSA